jgi:amino acid transporter
MMYSMAREKALPFHKQLAKVSPRTGTPIITSIIVGVGAMIALAVNMHQAAIFTALASLCIGMLYLAYLGVTLPLLFTRIKHLKTDHFPSGVDEDGVPQFSLGKWGIAINAVAVLYQIGMIINLMWPRPEIYDLTGGTWWLQWSALLFTGISLLGGAAYFYYRRLHRTIELAHVPHTHVPAPVPA